MVLVGPMGAGKTSVGKILAERLKLNFIDSDRELEERCGADIPWIFDIEGESGFRARETEILSELCKRSGILLATGGGAVISALNRNTLSQSGIVIYLSATSEQIYHRVRNDTGRPLLQVENPKAAIEDILRKREPFYREVADLTLSSAENESAQSMAGSVYEHLKERYPDQFGN